MSQNSALVRKTQDLVKHVRELRDVVNARYPHEIKTEDTYDTIIKNNNASIKSEDNNTPEEKMNENLNKLLTELKKQSICYGNLACAGLGV
jgi:hypothetical protein